MSAELPCGGIAAIREYRVLWSWGIESLTHCYSLYGRSDPCPRCPLRSGTRSGGRVEVNHPAGPREVLHFLPGLQLAVWPGPASPIDRLPRGVGTAVYSSGGAVQAWEGLHARRTGIEAGRAAGQPAGRLLDRLGSRRVRRQVEGALRGEPHGGVLAGGNLASVLLPAAEDGFHHLLIDLAGLGLTEPVYLLRPCFRHGGSASDPVSRLATVAESLGWSYDISPKAAEGFSTWMLPGVMDRLLAGILRAAAGLCPSLWLSCSTIETGEELWPRALPGCYLALDLELRSSPDRWQSEALRGLSQRMAAIGGWMKTDEREGSLRVAFPKGLTRPRASVGLAAYAGGEPGFGRVLESAEEAGVAVRVAESGEELARLQPITDGLLLGAAGPMPGLPAAVAARMPFQPLLVAGGTVHSAPGPGEPEYRIPLPAEMSTLVSALRRITG